MSLRSKILLACSLIVLGVAVRLLPHAWNATPLVASTILSGLYLGKRWALIVPIVTMLIGDIFIGFYEWPLMICVYSCFALIGYLSSRKLFAKKYNDLMLLSVSSSVIFFLATNWAVWQFTPWYTKTASGLLYCYFLALPFFRNAIFGDLFYTLTLFTICELTLRNVIPGFLSNRPQKLVISTLNHLKMLDRDA